MSAPTPGASTSRDRKGAARVNRSLAVAARYTRLNLVGFLSMSPSPRAASRVAHGRRARAVLFWFVAGALLLHAGAVLATEVAWPRLRDPEYGRRARQLRARVADHPDRPLVVVIGSSRTSMGVKPDAWEAVRPGARHDPLLFNMGTYGGGPIQELIVVRRLFADGFRPSVVLIEYWPLLLRQEGRYGDPARLDPRRLRWDDRPVVRDYFPGPSDTERRMRSARLNVFAENRERWMIQAAPEWVSKYGARNWGWVGLDRWGWVPGLDVQPDDATTRRVLIEHNREDVRDRFDGHAIDPRSDRALREAVAVARANGSRVGFLYLPESGEFQSWYPTEVEKSARAHLAGLVRDLGVPVIDARDWVNDDQLADGFHLSRVGAGPFTARLGRAVGTTFPATGGNP